MQLRQSTTASVQGELTARSISESPQRVLARTLDQADEKQLHALCTSFYTIDGKGEEIIWALHQFTNLEAAEALLEANKLTQYPFKLFYFLQRRCPCLLTDDLFIDAISKTLFMGKADTTAKLLLAAKICFPDISEELGGEFLLEDFSQPITDEKLIKAIDEATPLPTVLSTLIAKYRSDAADYECAPARIDGHDCLTWKQMLAFFDLQHILTNISPLPPSLTVKTATGTLGIFREKEVAGLGIEENLYRDGSIQLKLLIHYQNPNCKKLLAIFRALEQRNKITYGFKKFKGTVSEAWIGEKKSSDTDVLVYTNGNDQTMITLKTPAGMECGLKSLMHLKLIDPQQALPFVLHTMNRKCLDTEAKHCFLTKDFEEKVKPLRKLASKPGFMSSVFKKKSQVPVFVRNTAEQIIMLLDALSEQKDKQVSLTNERLKQAILHVLNTMPHKDSALTDERFYQAIAVFKLNFPMKHTRKSAIESKALPTTITIRPKESSASV